MVLSASHLWRKNDHMFNIINRITIFDLTNFYFEDRKDNSDNPVWAFQREMPITTYVPATEDLQTMNWNSMPKLQETDY